VTLSRSICLSVAAACLNLAGPGLSSAQLAGSATFETDYRVQGFDLTDGHPDGRFNVTYDSASGIYGGASAIIGETAGGSVHPLGYLGDIGFAKRMPDGVDWDVGLNDAQLALYVPATRLAPGATVYSQAYTHRYDLDYAEVYGGVSTTHFSAHLYVSPDYLGQDLRTAYLDVDSTIRPLEHLRLFGHFGALAPLGGASDIPGAHQGRLDVSAGAAWEALWGELKITFSATTPRLPYPADYDQHREAISVSLTRFF
jgi:Bacterial protein of unknown function (Gcw_chp)